MARRYSIPSYAESLASYVRDLSTTLNQFLGEVSNVKDSITASTTQTQEGAEPLVLGFNRVSSANSNDALRLPIPTGGGECIIRNDSGAAVQFFPHLGGKINDGTENAADGSTLADNTSRTYRATDGTNWYTI